MTDPMKDQVFNALANSEHDMPPFTLRIDKRRDASVIMISTIVAICGYNMSHGVCGMMHLKKSVAEFGIENGVDRWIDSSTAPYIPAWLAPVTKHILNNTPEWISLANSGT